MPTEKHPHLSRAPITEAILDISVESEGRFDNLDAFAASVSDSHPDASPLFAVEAFFSMMPGQSGMAGSQSNTVGRICWNEAKTRAVQGRIGGFTVNHVKSYESWDVLQAQARDLWSRYEALVKPIKVKRLALRYINRIEISSTGDLGEYMQTLPTLGPSLPNEILNLFMRVEVPFGDTTMAIVTQTVVPRVEGATERDLILDVDAVSTKEFSPKDEQLWVEFAKLREVKNTCFFGSLIDSTWRKYQ